VKREKKAKPDRKYIKKSVYVNRVSMVQTRDAEDWEYVSSGIFKRTNHSISEM
jgi:hypothetical protein